MDKRELDCVGRCFFSVKGTVLRYLRTLFFCVMIAASLGCSGSEDLLVDAGFGVDADTLDDAGHGNDAGQDGDVGETASDTGHVPDVEAPDVDEPTGEQAEVEILSGPEPLTGESEATLEFACTLEPDCEMQCRLNDEEFEPCQSPMTYEDLLDGEYRFEVVTVDDEGKLSSPASWDWAIDTEEPEIEVLAAPPSPSDQSGGFFEFECSNKEECTFECALETNGQIGEWESCSSGHVVEGLVSGDYTLHIRAFDALGNEGETSVNWTVAVTGWAGVTVGFAHTCAMASDGSIWCWGSGGRGRTGHGDGDTRFEPEQVGSNTDWDMISAGRTHTCALRDNGSLWCWGEGDQGRLGTGNESNRNTPTQVTNDTDFTYVSAGSYHSCALRDGGTLWCWGGNQYEQRGFGGSDDQLIPAQVGGGSDWTSVSASFAHTCGIREDQTLWCWGGGNERGQLGVGTTESRATPTRVGTQADWTLVSSGRRHTCGIRGDGTLWCWGSNGNGQLGQGSGSSNEYLVPTQVGGHTDWGSVVAFNYHTCGIREGGTLWCWGWNDFGQVGQGNTDDWESPQQVDADAEWESTATGSTSHSCAIRTAGTLWCWGRGAEGRLGLGDEDNKHQPHLVGGDLF